MSELERAEFRAAAGHFATGVTVITGAGENGPTGMTANAFTSLSLDPPLVIVCFDLTARTLGAVRRSGRVGINVLAAGQEAISTAFASKASEAEKFEGVGWHEHAGAPILDGVVAWFAGGVKELLPGGDHLIGVIEVEELGAPGGEPLIFHRGGYASLAPG